MTYQQQIKDPRWQKKRLEVLQECQFECQSCGARDKELHVHHPFYRRGAMIWQYESSELACLCHECHKEAHALDERIKRSFAYASLGGKWKALGALDAYELWNGYSANNVIQIANAEYADGVSSVFSLTTPLLFENLKDGSISLDELLQLRRERRISLGLPVFPPAVQQVQTGEEVF